MRKWLDSEEESFGRTLAQGSRLLDELIARAQDSGAEGISAEDAFLLHDTYGFPIDLTLELVAEHGLGVDEEGFESLMDEQRARARASSGRDRAREELRERALEFAGSAGFATDFVGYETTDRETTVGALVHEPTTAKPRVLVKLVESPFYATGGGQVADSGYVECADGDCRARVDDVLRLGDDQVVALVPERGELKPGERVRAHVDRRARHATECNHTATHLLHAALRQRLGTHVHQAGSYVGPDKLRFDFTHGSGLSAEELTDVEDQVNAWILESQPVRALTTTLDEAKRARRDGAVRREVRRRRADGRGRRRVVLARAVRRHARAHDLGDRPVQDPERDLERGQRPPDRGGHRTAAVELMRHHDRALADAAETLRVPAGACSRGRLRAARARRASSSAAPAAARRRQRRDRSRRAARRAVELDGARVLAAAVSGVDGKALLELADRLKAKLGDAAIVLGSAGEDRVDLVASVAPALVARGVRAGEIVKVAAAVVGGGGGGRDTLARAGGRDPAQAARGDRGRPRGDRGRARRVSTPRSGNR